MMGSSTEPAVFESGATFCIAAGFAKFPSAPDKSGTIGFARGLAVCATLPDQQMQQPGRFFLGCARAPGAENGGRVGNKFSLHKQIAKGRVELIRSLGGEHDFGVTRQFDRARGRKNDWSG